MSSITKKSRRDFLKSSGLVLGAVAAPGNGHAITSRFK